METTIITEENFNDTIVDTIDCHTLKNGSAYYLDQHECDAAHTHYTVSKDEVLLKCFSNYNEAKTFLNRISC